MTEKVDINCTNVKSTSGVFGEPCTQLKCPNRSTSCRGYVHDRVCRDRPSDGFRALCVTCALPNTASTLFLTTSVLLMETARFSSDTVVKPGSAETRLPAPSSGTRPDAKPPLSRPTIDDTALIVGVSVSIAAVVIILIGIVTTIVLRRQRMGRRQNGESSAASNYGVIAIATYSDTSDVRMSSSYGNSSFSGLA
jgi:hypothetical protein